MSFAKHLDMQFELDYSRQENKFLIQFPTHSMLVLSFSFIRLKDSKHLSFIPTMHAIYFVDALKIKWLENLTYIFPQSTILVIIEEGGCKFLNHILNCLLLLNSSRKRKGLV